MAVLMVGGSHASPKLPLSQIIKDWVSLSSSPCQTFYVSGLSWEVTHSSQDSFYRVRFSGTSLDIQESIISSEEWYLSAIVIFFRKERRSLPKRGEPSTRTDAVPVLFCRFGRSAASRHRFVYIHSETGSSLVLTEKTFLKELNFSSRSCWRTSAFWEIFPN